MNSEQLNEYGAKLCEEIKLHYLKDFMLCVEGENWAFKSEASMRNFVLSRPDWKQGDQSNELFVFKGKHPIIVNIIYCGSAGMLLITTAINIAKAELVDEFKEGDIEENINTITECINKQDWIIPFVRKRNN